MDLKTALKKLIPIQHTYRALHLKKKFSLHNFLTETYSGDGEDIVLKSIFKNKKEGFYVDVGAFHPKYISNTHLLHKRGWHGINIDPNSDTIELFKKYRPHDINLNFGINSEEVFLEYYNFTHSGVNTFDKEHAESKTNSNGNKLIDVKKINAYHLKQSLKNI